MSRNTRTGHPPPPIEVVVTRQEMEQEVGQLLLEQRRLRRFDLELGPAELLRLKRLLYRLGYTKGIPMSRSPHVTRRRYRKPLVVSYDDRDLDTTKPTKVAPITPRPDARPKTGTGVLDGGLPRVDLDLQLFKQHVRAKHVGQGPGTVKPNSPEERGLLADFARQRGLKVQKSPYAYYDEQSHTLYHPTPENKAAVGETYVKHSEGKVKLTRRVVRFAKPPVRPPHPDLPPQRTPTDLITHAGHALDNPTDSTAIRAFADHLLETHPEDRHAQAFMEWVNGGGWHGPTWVGAMYHPRGENLGIEGIKNEPYFSLNPRRVATPGQSRTQDDTAQPLGLLSKRLDSPLWEFRTRMPRKTVVSPLDGITHRASAPARGVPKMTSTEVAQHLYDVDGVRGLAIAVIGARHFHPDVTPPTPNEYTPSRPKFSRRRYAKAETTRHPAHPLIAGFPLEHALRHLANDVTASSQLRDTAKHVLTTGDSSGLWGLHDLVHEHENADGTTGHPILKAGYNFMSAADKVHLDAKTRLGLVDLSNRVKALVPSAHHEHWNYTPEYQAARASHDEDHRKRVLAAISKYTKGVPPEDVEESLDRHAHRAHRQWAEANGGGKLNDFAKDAVEPVNTSTTASHRREAKATRYARLTVGKGEPLMGGADFMHEVHDETGNRVGHIWVTPQGDHLHVNHVGMTGHTPNSAGLDVVRQVRQQLKGHYPAAKTIGGTRISGAVKKNTGKDRPTARPLSRRKVKVVRYAADVHDVQSMLRQLQQPEHGSHMAGLDDPLSGLRGIAADALDEQGRSEEATLLRTPGTHVEVRADGTVKPSFMERQGISNTYGGPHVREQFVKPSYDGVREAGSEDEHHGMTYWFAKYGHPGKVQQLPSGGYGYVADKTQPKRWFWNPADGEGMDSEELQDDHPQYRHYPTTEELPDGHDLSPSELAYMRHHATTPQFKLSRVKRYAKPNRSDFLDALRRMKSSNHSALTTAAVDVARRMGVGDTKVLSALHDTPHGAVPGVAQAIYGTAKPETVHALAAWVNGLLPNGPGYAVFHARPTGPDTLYRIRHDGSGMDLRVRLDRAGIDSRVLIPHRKGFDVLVPDKGNRLAANVDAYAKQHGLSVEASPGHFQTVGSPDQGEARSQMRDRVVAGERQQMQRRGPRRYGQDLPTTIQQNREASRLRTDPDLPIRQIQDVAAGGVLADALDESGEPHAPFYRNLVHRYAPPSVMPAHVHNPLGRQSIPASFTTANGRYEQSGSTGHAADGFELFPVTHTETGNRAFSVTHRPDPQIPPRRRGRYPTASAPHHIAVLDAPALREWASHPKVGESLRAALVNAANHLEGTGGPERKSRVSLPKRYAEVPTKAGEEWIKDFKVPVSYDLPAGNVGVNHYAPRRNVHTGQWEWRTLEHLGYVRDHDQAKELFPNAMHEDEFFGRRKSDGYDAPTLTPEEVYLATDGKEGTAPTAGPDVDYRPTETIPEDYYAMSAASASRRRRAITCR